jgi:hypothetical protein
MAVLWQTVSSYRPKSLDLHLQDGRVSPLMHDQQPELGGALFSEAVAAEIRLIDGS